jgi:hypothetical protein
LIRSRSTPGEAVGSIVVPSSRSCSCSESSSSLMVWWRQRGLWRRAVLQRGVEPECGQ